MEFSQYILPVAATVAAGYAAYKYFTRPRDIFIPEPTVKRTNLRFGYYGAFKDQANEVKDHVNLWWESQFQGEEKAIENIKITRKYTVLDVAPQCMVRIEDKGRNHHYREDSEQRLRAFFDKMRANDVLKYVKAIYPMDEPNINTPTPDLKKAIDVIKKVVADYSELTGVKLLCIYAAKPETYDCIEYFDIVGVDDYESLSGIFENGIYSKLKNRLRPDQKTIVIPGGAFGQDPTPFVNFAHTNTEVMAIVSFVWFTGFNEADTWIGIGEDANPRKQDYIRAGLKIVVG